MRNSAVTAVMCTVLIPVSVWRSAQSGWPALWWMETLAWTLAALAWGMLAAWSYVNDTLDAERTRRRSARRRSGPA